MTLWPCSHCGGRGVRNMGTDGYCAWHLSELLATFNPATFAFRGVGVLDGALRPDMGPPCAELRCVACAATWVGVVGDLCRWCQRAHEVTLEHQADIVLRPPDVDLDDERYPAALKAWGERLARAVKAGIVDKRDAKTAWHRGVTRGHAA